MRACRRVQRVCHRHGHVLRHVAQQRSDCVLHDDQDHERAGNRQSGAGIERAEPPARECGLAMARCGETTFEEVLRVTRKTI